MNERIKQLRKALDLTQQEFADKIGTTRNNIAGYETGRRLPSEAAINLIIVKLNVSETWLRTGEGEMFVPNPASELEALAKKYDLSHDSRILVEEFVNLKPEMQQVFIDFARKAAENFRSELATPAPSAISKSETTTPTPDTTGQERAQPDLAAKVAELERQNQALAAKVAAMEEEDALLGLTDASSKSPSVSVGNFNPAQRAKK